MRLVFVLLNKEKEEKKKDWKFTKDKILKAKWEQTIKIINILKKKSKQEKVKEYKLPKELRGKGFKLKQEKVK